MYHVQKIIHIDGQTTFGVWSPNLESTHEKKSDAIENVQRRASKRIPGLSHLTYKQKLEAIKLPTLQQKISW